MIPSDSRTNGDGAVGSWTTDGGGASEATGGAPAVFVGAVDDLAGAFAAFAGVLAAFGDVLAVLRGSLAFFAGALAGLRGVLAAFDPSSRAFVDVATDAPTESAAGLDAVSGRRPGAHAPTNRIAISGSRAQPVMASLVEGLAEGRRSGPAYLTLRAHRRYPFFL